MYLPKETVNIICDQAHLQSLRKSKPGPRGWAQILASFLYSFSIDKAHFFLDVLAVKETGVEDEQRNPVWKQTASQ